MFKTSTRPALYGMAGRGVYKETVPPDDVQEGFTPSELNNFRKKKYSENGEEGILEEIVRRIDVDKGWFVELGAGNGVRYCNTRVLAEEGWKGLYIEGSKPLFVQLQYSTSKFPDVKTHKCYVNCEPDTNLDDIMDKYEVPMDFDILSLDIDGNDYWVWDSLMRMPKIVIIEYNSNYPNEASRTIKYDPQFRWAGDNYQGATARAMFKLGTKKDYKLVAQLGVNMFFVHNKYGELFTEFPIDQIPMNKLEGQERRKLPHSRNMIDV